MKYDTEGRSIPTNPVPTNNLVVPTNNLIDTGADTDFMSYTTCCRLRLQDRLTNHDGLGCSLQRAGQYRGRLENIRLFLGTPGAEEEVVVISPMVHDHPDIDILIGCPTCENEGWILAPRDNTIKGPNNLYITTYPSVNIVNQQMEKFSEVVGTQDEYLTDEQQGADLYPENIPSPMPVSAYVASPADMNYFSMPLQQVSPLVSPFLALHNHMPVMPESISENTMEDFNISLPLRPATAPGTSSIIDTTEHGDAPNGGTLSPLYGVFDGHDVEMQHVQDTHAAIYIPDLQNIPPMPSMAVPLTSLTWLSLQQSMELSTASSYNSMSILQSPMHPPALSVWDFAAATGELDPPSEMVEHGDDSVSSMFHVWNTNPSDNNELIFVLESGLPSVVHPKWTENGSGVRALSDGVRHENSKCLLGVARSKEFDRLQQYFVPGFTDDVEMQGLRGASDEVLIATASAPNCERTIITKDRDFLNTPPNRKGTIILRGSMRVDQRCVPVSMCRLRNELLYPAILCLFQNYVNELER
ncbi:hypothetical protein BC938DRAFT_474784 [Jimgerdemannia flammicorona]|uniref:Uncharacterized protein n=1 Tax=Jimgerdemannia flammicorona TaxID=994334 RepID=A0A433QSA7_9FUNG|nr:hypothetical protein BC938DRAFT_474784 [Jimgerdemannia flammicorona]